MYLNCKTYYSFKYGTFSTEELVQTAADKGVTALTLTNINSTYDAWDFVKHCRERNIKPLLGAEIRNGDSLVCVLIASNNRGLASIHRIVSEHLVNDQKFPDTLVSRRLRSATYAVRCQFYRLTLRRTTLD